MNEPATTVGDPADGPTGCCSKTPTPTTPCCDAGAEAERSDACCGAAAKQRAVAAGQGCCG